MLKSLRTNTLAVRLIERISSMLDETESKTVHSKKKKEIDRGKRSKTLSKAKLVKNISKNLQSFLELSPCKRKSFFHINCKTMLMSNRIF